MLSRADNTGGSLPTAVPFAIERRDLDPHTSIVAIEGELDLASAPRLKWMLLDALADGHSRLVLDLTLATFMDSTALGVLVVVNRSLSADGALVIVCANAGVLKIFELSGMDGAFAILSTVAEALARLDPSAAQAHAGEAQATAPAAAEAS
jgi:anti-sigma B factor antagonist